MPPLQSEPVKKMQKTLDMLVADCNRLAIMHNLASDAESPLVRAYSWLAIINNMAQATQMALWCKHACATTSRRAAKCLLLCGIFLWIVSEGSGAGCKCVFGESASDSACIT